MHRDKIVRSIFRYRARLVTRCIICVATMILLSHGAMALEPTAKADPSVKYRQVLIDHAQTEMRSWALTPLVIDSIIKQNKKSSTMTQSEIKLLDRKWRTERVKFRKPLIHKLLTNELSQYLKFVQEHSEGLYTEILVMDNKGALVGSSALTTDYWQGDENKWLKTFVSNSRNTYIEPLYFDESSNAFQVPVSFTIFDKDGEKAIGAISVGINVEKFER